MGSNADFEPQELRRIEFGVHRLIFPTKIATSRLADRLKYGAMAIADDARRHGSMYAATSIRDTRSQSGA